MDAEQITAWLSEQRFAPFLQRAEGDHVFATQIYLWHAQVAGASLTTLHHFEVALRNAIDRQLGSGQPRKPVAETWLLDQNLQRRLDEMITVANAIDPDCGEWLTTHTQLIVLIKQRPGSE